MNLKAIYYSGFKMLSYTANVLVVLTWVIKLLDGNLNFLLCR
jgi:hypothetical protein